MCTRNSIAILNEISQKNNIKIMYEIQSIGDVNTPLFRCKAQFGIHKYMAEGLSKKSAKEMCANELLTKHDMYSKENVQENLSNSLIMDNYVGKLNEYCSKNRLHYADYIQDACGNQYIVKCKLDDLEFTGLSSNKKEAKQLAAKNMLKILENQSESKVKSVIIKQKLVDQDEIIKKFHELKLQTQFIKQEKKEEVTKIDDNVMLNFHISVLQANPLILVAKHYKDECLTFIANGETYTEAIEKLHSKISKSRSNLV